MNLLPLIKRVFIGIVIIFCTLVFPSAVGVELFFAPNAPRWAGFYLFPFPKDGNTNSLIFPHPGGSPSAAVCLGLPLTN